MLGAHGVDSLRGLCPVCAVGGAAFARLCPKPDADNQQSMLESVAVAAAAARNENNEAMTDAPALLMIPLGVLSACVVGAFTFRMMCLVPLTLYPLEGV